MKKFFLKSFKKFFSQKIFLWILLILSVFTFSSVYAQGSEDITSSDFMISLGKLDPIHWETAANTVSGEDSLKHVMETVANVILMLVPLLAAVAIVIAGYFYIFSYADSDNITKAKTIIKYNIIAVIVAFTSGWIIRIIASFL